MLETLLKMLKIHDTNSQNIYVFIRNFSKTTVKPIFFATFQQQNKYSTISIIKYQPEISSNLIETSLYFTYKSAKKK